MLRVTHLLLRDFRCYERGQIKLGSGMTVVTGPNGAGKTNLLEALYFACTGRSCRTKNDRDVVRFGAQVMRLELGAEDDYGQHRITVGFSPGETKRFHVDGASVERLVDHDERPLVSVFMPDRLDLLTGPPALRRAHIDQVIAVLWPARRATRSAFSSALAQRNALIARVRSGSSGQSSFDAWNHELARHAIALMQDRRELVECLRGSFAKHADALGLDGDPLLSYRPRARATTVDDLVQELEANTAADIESGFTILGPHRDALLFKRAGRDLRSFGSRGQLRIALLALLLAERDELSNTRGRVPIMLLDEAMSELDGTRRRQLVDLLITSGQSLITTTELDHVPRAHDFEVTRYETKDGEVGALN